MQGGKRKWEGKKACLASLSPSLSLSVGISVRALAEPCTLFGKMKEGERLYAT